MFLLYVIPAAVIASDAVAAASGPEAHSYSNNAPTRLMD
jgi:hypothetical protein